MHHSDLEFYFDPVCPFCWVTSQWVRNVERQRPLSVDWRPLSLRILNEPIGYDTRPAAYPDAHQRGLEMLRVVAAARRSHGRKVVGDLYEAMGEAVWHAPSPEEPTFEAVLDDTSRPRDLDKILTKAGLPADLAEAANDMSFDDEAVELWDSISTLARWEGFAELKRGLRSFPDTPLTAELARQPTEVR